MPSPTRKMATSRHSRPVSVIPETVTSLLAGTFDASRGLPLGAVIS